MPPTEERRTASSLRNRSFTSGTRRSHTVETHAPDHASGTVRGGLACIRCFRTMDSTEEVAEWLRVIGMVEYAPTFRANSVTGCTLLSLNSVELRKTLGVNKLKDRRILLDSIRYLHQALSMDAQRTIPEDGRILTHLSNERVFLTWLRFSVIMQTVGIATIRLTNLSNERNETYITAVAVFSSALAIIAMAYGTMRHYRIQQLIEAPGPSQRPENVAALLPILFLFVSVVIVLYVLTSHDTEEAAILALLSI